MIRLSGPFAQLLRYAAPADAQSTIVRLRSAGTASLAFERKSALKSGKRWGKKRQKKAKKEQVLRKKVEKRKKREKNDSFLRVNLTLFFNSCIGVKIGSLESGKISLSK